MIGGRIAAVLAIILALSGWGLYKQIEKSGKLQQLIEERDVKLSQKDKAISDLRDDIAARDAATLKLEGEQNELRKNLKWQQKKLQDEYRTPEVIAWADAVPPASVAAAVTGGIDCLWQHGADRGNADCGAVATGVDDG